MWRSVPRAADRNRLVPDWLRSRSLAPENWLHVSPGAAYRDVSRMVIGSSDPQAAR
jgi:hypothetical protein